MQKTMLILVYILFLIPKVNLITIGGFYAGIRADDVIILFIGMCFFSNFLYTKKINIERTFATFIFIMLVGSVVCGMLFSQGSILFPLRFIEYSIFFYLGRYLYNDSSERLSNLIGAVFWVNVAISVLQVVGVVGGFTVMGYKPNVSDRIIGMTSGPWELGVLMNFTSAFYLIYGKNSLKRYIPYVLASVIILLTGSRMSFVAQLVIIAVFIIKQGSFIQFLKKALIAVPLVFAMFIYVENSSVSSRSENLFNSDNITSLASLYEQTNVTYGNPDWHMVDTMAGDDVDLSWAMRVMKWLYAIKLFFKNPIFFVTGVGAGTFGNALDGGWLRLLLECGVFGFYAFLVFLKKVKNSSPMMLLFTIALGVNMLMIDVYMSYKIMTLYLFFAGYMLTWKGQQNEANQNIAFTAKVT